MPPDGLLESERVIKTPSEGIAMAASKAGILKISKEAEAVLKSDPAYERLARATVEQYARRLKELDELTKDSTLTEADAIRLGRKIRKGAYRRMMSE
jgi:hypothetical protein